MTDGPAPRYEPIAVSSESTVVAEFIPDPAQGSGYQSEAELERTFIELLREQAYEYLPLTSEGELIAKSVVEGAPKFSAGDRVFHVKFGYGKVTSIEGNKLTVAFEKAGEKKVIDSFVEPAAKV